MRSPNGQVGPGQGQPPHRVGELITRQRKGNPDESFERAVEPEASTGHELNAESTSDERQRRAEWGVEFGPDRQPAFGHGHAPLRQVLAQGGDELVALLAQLNAPAGCDVVEGGSSATPTS